MIESSLDGYIRNKGDDLVSKLDEVAKGMQGCGCILMMLPVLVILLFFMYAILTG